MSIIEQSLENFDENFWYLYNSVDSIVYDDGLTLVDKMEMDEI